MTDEQLSALLRLKRFEQPPAQYFDHLLENIHRRQRADLLRLPLWKIGVERIQTFFSEHSMGHVSYAGALASLLVVGVAAIGLMTPGGSIQRTETQLVAAAPTPLPEKRLLTLQDTKPAPTIGAPAFQTPAPAVELVASQPRYIIDARPVNYEPSSF